MRAGAKYKWASVVTREWGPEHVQSAMSLIMAESGFNPFAINPTSGAAGLFQALPASKMGCELPNTDCQMRWGTSYIKNRYGTPTKAYSFWLQNRWY